MRAESPRAGSVEWSWCRDERRETAWRYGGTQNHSTPCAVTWICTTAVCGRVRIALADLDDAEGFVRTMLRRRFQATGAVAYDDVRSVEWEELVQDGWARLMRLYASWDPARGTTFTSYATFYLPKRLNEFLREQRGRDGTKAHADAVSLDADPGRGSLGESLGSWAGDPATSSSAALSRALLRRGGA